MPRNGAHVVVTRVLGAVTAAYSAALVVSPRILAKPTGLAGRGGEVPGPVRTLIAAIGARDTAIGAAMMFATPGLPLRTAVATRVAADLADAAVFGLTLPDRAARRKVAVFAVSWALLCGVFGLRR
ncbi:hypothetical protein [Nocardia sp. NRRL S-836]|uniref:hypothetical protein n=1 Tax=Nocardia sp. NRRL S-836 TaxID=1519492 RepID=UPI0006ADD163|nr:hypothetical protein [Nocardia sp. NRRL S-836]KOV85227.1 hypothetical protein ADL03_13590 [Nocardia sp. NRRL S-836]